MLLCSRVTALRRSAHYACSIVSIAKRGRNCRGKSPNCVKRIRIRRYPRSPFVPCPQILQPHPVPSRRPCPQLHRLRPRGIISQILNRWWMNHSCCSDIGYVSPSHLERQKVLTFQCFLQSESNDAFNQFWKITEGMLNYLSQPVAFATAPLSPPENSVSLTRREPGSSSDTDIEDPITRRLSKGVGFMKSAKSKMLARHGPSNASDSDSGRAGINTFPPKPLHSAPIDDWDDDVETYGASMWNMVTIIPILRPQMIWQTLFA